MQRSQIDLPETFPFETTLVTRISDINYGNHVGNDAMQSLLHEARLRFFAAHGFSELDAGGCGLAMVEARVQYRSQAFRGDRLRIGVALDGLERVGFDLLYRVVRESDGVEIARAITTLVFFDYARGRVVRAPEAFRAAFGQQGTPGTAHDIG